MLNVPPARRARRIKVMGPGLYDRGQSLESRRAEQRNRLLMAAMQVFALKGYANATVEDIVKRARVSRRSYYENFSDLSDALLQVFDMAINDLLRAVEEALRGKSDPLERYDAGIRAYLSLVQQHADLARVIHREIRSAGPKHALRYELALTRFVALMSEGQTEAYARGLISRAPDEMTLYALVAGLEAVAMRYIERGEEARIMDAAPVLIELMFRAFR
jgi:AcrR family transcriptional regulator